MAVVNQYTQLSTPRYTPRTLQELMLVPAYKREQHNAIDEGIAAQDDAHDLAAPDAVWADGP